MLQNLVFRRLCLIIVASACVLSTTAPVFAAEQIVLKYRVFRQSFAVKELSTFADTGQPSLTLRAALMLARQDPQKVRNYLTAPVKVNSVILNRVLNSPVGNVILDQISQVIHTPGRKTDRQAMRSALVLSAAKDNDIRLIEVIRNYPTTEVEVDGDNLEKAYRQLRSLQGSLQNMLKF
jgi:Alpha/beta hydrolase of unknown function (DUF1400)